MDKYYMSLAIEEAKKALMTDDVPIGAVIVKDGEIIASEHNLRQANKDATAHAEILAVKKACEKLGTRFLDGCTMYVTLEPCPMCAGAAINSGISRVVFGAFDSRDGSFGSLINLSSFPYSRRPQTEGGIMEEECKKMLSGFFSELRRKKENK